MVMTRAKLAERARRKLRKKKKKSSKRTREDSDDTSSSGTSNDDDSTETHQEDDTRKSSGDDDSSSSSSSSSSDEEEEDDDSSESSLGVGKRRRKKAVFLDPTVPAKERKTGRPVREAARLAMQKLDAGFGDSPERYERTLRKAVRKSQSSADDNDSSSVGLGSDDSDNDRAAQARELSRLKRRQANTNRKVEKVVAKAPVPDEHLLEDSSDDDDDGAITSDATSGEEFLNSDDERQVKNSMKRRVNINDHLKKRLKNVTSTMSEREKEKQLIRAVEKEENAQRHTTPRKPGGTTASIPPASGGGGDGCGAPNATDDAGENAHGNPHGPSEREALGDISPLSIDASISFESVGGLPSHILTLREMVLLPLLYPDLMKRMNITPPKGVLFYGPPGTGKTLMARALANEGKGLGRSESGGGGGGISFFMRKGGDLLSKWIGESERQLKMLFDEARRSQPSIIFFDEIDGVAPMRNTNIESTHGSVVSTLLALMDGLDERGQVIVIGATNRPDTLDPALRRPGRFDRELNFPHPAEAARRHILSIHCKKVAPVDVPEGDTSFLDGLAKRTEGWCGADLKALVTEANLMALRRCLPQLYVSRQRLLVDPTAVTITAEDFKVAAARVQPSAQRIADGAAQALALGQHCDLLGEAEGELVLAALRCRWGPAEAVFNAQRKECDDLTQAAVDFAKGTSVQQQTGIGSGATFMVLMASNPFSATLTTSVVARNLPTFAVHCVHLPNLASISGEDGSGGGGGGGPGTNSSSFAGHITHVISTGRPTVLVLLGFDHWCADLQAHTSDEAYKAMLAALHYNLSRLSFHTVLVLIPTVQKGSIGGDGDTCGRSNGSGSTGGAAQAPLPSAICRILPTSGESNFHNVLQWICDPHPTNGTLHRFAKFLLDEKIAQMVSVVPPPAEWPVLPVDTKPLNLARFRKLRSSEKAKVMAERKKYWERVQYKRAQLRVVLRAWTASHVGNAAFRPLMDGDLDLADKDDEDLKGWRKHIKGRKIGLSDIVDKLDNCEYTALSQYNADIQQLCENVQRFFNGRDPKSIRYRSKALQLREATMLNNHRINKMLAQFCEETVKEDDPTLDDDSTDTEDEAEMGEDLAVRKVGQKSTREEATADKTPVKPPPKKKKRRRCIGTGCYGTPRRRKKPKPKPKPTTPEEETSSSSSDGDGDAAPQGDGTQAPMITDLDGIIIDEGDALLLGGGGAPNHQQQQQQEGGEGGDDEQRRSSTPLKPEDDTVVASKAAPHTPPPPAAAAPASSTEVRPQPSSSSWMSSEAEATAVVAELCQGLSTEALHGLYCDLQCVSLPGYLPPVPGATTTAVSSPSLLLATDASKGSVVTTTEFSKHDADSGGAPATATAPTTTTTAATPTPRRFFSAVEVANMVVAFVKEWVSKRGSVAPPPQHDALFKRQQQGQRPEEATPQVAATSSSTVNRTPTIALPTHR